jgi:hypothetical protein
MGSVRSISLLEQLRRIVLRQACQVMLHRSCLYVEWNSSLYRVE